MTAPTGPPAASLRDARESERLQGYLQGIWRRRGYIWYVSKSELRSRQIGSVLGNLWHLLNPILQIAIYFLFFGLILETRRGVDNFLGYLAIGVFTYTFTQKAVQAGARSLIKYQGLIQIVAFPRATLPLTTTLTESLATLPAYVVMILVTLGTGEPVALAWVVLVPVFALQVMFTAGCSLVAARATSHLPDVQQILPFVFRLGFYASGVLFNINAYLEDSPYQSWLVLNPVYCYIELNRAALLDNHGVDPAAALSAIVWAVVMLLAGFWWFRRAEDSYGEN